MTNHYVRQGATGSNNGSDWTNAWTQLPSTLFRGDTYYLADGSYNGEGFNTPISGTTFIYIKKATIAGHGTDTGWSDSYGDGQAVFNSVNIDATDTSLHPGYIEIDGQINYGIKFINLDLVPTSGGAGIILRMGPTTNGVIQFHVYHSEFVGPGGSTPYNHINGNKGIFEGGYPGPTDGLIISNNSFHGMATPIQLNGGTDAIIEYNDFYDVLVCGTPSTQHTNILWLANFNDITIRYNKAHNYDTEGFLISGAYNGNWYIYGNLFYDGYTTGGCYPRGIELYNNINADAVFYIYNNSCVDMNLACIRVMAFQPSIGDIGNNLGYGANSGFWLYNMPNSNNTLTTDSSIFVNYTNKNFHLKNPTSPGLSLPSPFNIDPDGNTRGADGVWDRGAYEYVSTPECPTPIVTFNLNTT